MDKELKMAICRAYEAPLPGRKEEFLQKIPQNSMQKSSLYEIICSQIGYIHKGAWFSATAIFGAILYFLSQQEPNTVFLCSALTPFLALGVLIESGRSQRYNMAELESATKYSLRSTIFSKMLILGIFDLIVLLLIISLTQLQKRYGLLLTAAYILLPYLLTMWLGLMIERTSFGREIPYSVMGISTLISVLMFISTVTNIIILKPDYGIWWEFGTFILIAEIILSGQKRMDQLEESIWN